MVYILKPKNMEKKMKENLNNIIRIATNVNASDVNSVFAAVRKIVCECDLLRLEIKSEYKSNRQYFSENAKIDRERNRAAKLELKKQMEEEKNQNQAELDKINKNEPT
jgi:hypothetical protein